MRRIFISDLLKENITITGPDAHHLSRVMRSKEGDHIVVADDEGRVGEYVMTEKNKYLNISDLENQLKPEDIQRRVNKLNSNKYKGFIRFSKIQMEGGKYFAYVEDPNGKYIYNKDAQKFIDITK